MSSPETPNAMSEPPSPTTKLDISAETIATDDHKAHQIGFLASFSREEDRMIMRKVDIRFLPLLGFMYLFKQIDYANTANIKVLQVGLPSNILKELHMTANEYNWVATIYFMGIIFLEVPSTLLLKKLTPRKWITRIFLSWGIAVSCHATISNKEGYYALRFLLGAMEGGFFSCVATQLCSWYRSDEYAKPITWMFAFQNCSGIVGSLLTYGISYMDGVGGLSAWRCVQTRVFILEGILTILFSAIIYVFLPDYPKSPRSSGWLAPREQEYLELRLSETAPRTNDAAFDKKEIFMALKDPKNYAFCLCQLFLNVGGYGVSWQTPTIVTSLGFTALPRNQLLIIPPSLCTVIGIIIASLILRKGWILRPLFCQILAVAAFIFFIILCVPVSTGATYAACVLGTAFYYTYFIPFWAWRSSSLKGSTGAAFTISVQTVVAQVGSLIGPQLFQMKFAYNGYKTSFIICTVFMAAAVGTTAWVWVLTRKVEMKILKEQRVGFRDESKVDATLANF